MKILVALTYYSPYISGLTIYAERIARAWAKAGHDVVVLTSRHNPELPEEEVLDGVLVVRAPVLLRISKGAVMPAFWAKAVRWVEWADVVNLHLPQFDAAWVAWLGKRKRKFTILTYHCDLMMPPGVVNQVSNRFVLWMNDLAGRFCDQIVAYTDDYAAYSFFLPKFSEKIRIIQPPVELPEVSDAAVAAFRQKWNAVENSPIIGMACRFAADKGVEVLLDALPKIIERFPDCCVYFAGPYQDVLGERAYYERLRPRLQEFINAGHWKFLGSLPPSEMAKFYRTIDLLTMPSLNRTDAFGLVQIEAMMNGKPSVAADLPGIRVPVRRHGMGRIFPVGDSAALAEAIIRTAEENKDYSERCQGIKDFYRPAAVAAAYDELLKAYGIE